ncbi:MAG: hypothetical protein ACQER9_02475 [Nanobdellota archaeon]
MLLETKLPMINYREGKRIFNFPEVDLRIQNKGRLEVYVKAPYLHPQVFQSEREWLLMDVDPILPKLREKNLGSMLPLIVNYLENCQDEIPCHKKYLN